MASSFYHLKVPFPLQKRKKLAYRYGGLICDRYYNVSEACIYVPLPHPHTLQRAQNPHSSDAQRPVHQGTELIF